MRWGYEPVTEPHGPAAEEGPLICVRDVTLAFGSKVILHNLAFDIHQGSIFAIMGGSGCGKSTMLQSMIGLLRPDAGEITVAGEDYWACDEARRAAIDRRFGVLFQDSALWSALTVGENGEIQTRLGGHRKRHRPAPIRTERGDAQACGACACAGA
jgi:phospholipid/cholesterol/gamma-HCH transport system ATP-binding protein